MKLHLEYRENISGGDALPGESGPYAQREDEYKDFHPIALWTEPGSAQETLEYKGDMPEDKQLYLAYALYTDGDTFGTSHGNWHILGLFSTHDEADAMASRVQSGELEKEAPAYYYPWTGYFAGLEGVGIASLPVRDGSCPGITWHGLEL